MATLEQASRTIVRTCMGVKSKEKVLIITDKAMMNIANRMEKEVKKIGAKVDLISVKAPKINGTEPPKSVAKAMLGYDVILMPTSSSFSHTKARLDATKKGIRIASMPRITEDMMKRCIVVDYKQMKRDAHVLSDILDKGKWVTIETKKGTDLSFSIKNRIAHGRSGGVFTQKGKWGNLPEAESSIGPVERTANGKLVVDGSIAGIGKVDKNVVLEFRRGNVVRISGGKVAKKFEKILHKVGPKAKIIAELGIGVNEKAKITGNVLEDEKIKGTCHIAVGNNILYGGKNSVQLHIDSVIKKPTISVDGRVIIREGKFLI